MTVLDTHSWVWHTAEPALLSSRARKSIASASVIGICAISLWEIAMLVEKKRISFDRPVADWLSDALAKPRVELIPISVDIAVRSTTLAPDFHGDPSDRLIVATAAVLRATLVTKDQRIRASKIVDTIW